jgi:hypothetical protein
MSLWVFYFQKTDKFDLYKLARFQHYTKLNLGFYGWNCTGIHFGEGEAFLSEILERRSDKIYFFVIKN